MRRKIFYYCLAAIVMLWAGLAHGADQGTTDSAYRYGYSPKYGQIDMANVIVNDDGLTGYALIGAEQVSLNSSLGRVTNDGQNHFAGSAHSNSYGFFNFAGVYIDSSGYWHGTADGGAISGQIYFDCTDPAQCGTPKVRTIWQTTATAIATTNTTTATTPATAADYQECSKYNDYLSYVQCVAAVDNRLHQNTGQIAEGFLPGSSTDYAVTINNGQATTTVATVSVQLKAPAAAALVALSHDSNFGFSTREAFASAKTWQLDDVAGTRYVYAKFFDKDGAALYIASASINYQKADSATVITPASSDTITTAPAVACQPQVNISGGLGLGASGDAVKVAQKQLQCLGYLATDYNVKGQFDDTTEKAVKDFQAKYDLKCKDKTYCGYVGPGTAKALNTDRTPIVATIVATTPTAAPVAAKSPVAGYKFTQVLTIGSRGNDVTNLQKLLAADTTLYPEAKVTGFFGPLTEAAVKKFQEHYDLKCADKTYCGYVGPATRAKLNEVNK